MKVLKRLDQVTVGSIDLCMYCGTAEPDRTKEHIIAESLGGNLVIKNASCRACSELTKQFEGSVAGNTYKILRAANNYRSKRPKGMPSVEYLTLEKPNGTKQRIAVPLDELPLLVVVPSYPAPPFAKSIPGLSPESQTLTIRFLPDDFEFHNRVSKIQRAHSGKLQIRSRAFLVGDFEKVLYKTFLGLLQWKTPESPYLNALRNRVVNGFDFLSPNNGINGVIPPDLYSLPNSAPDLNNVFSISFFVAVEDGLAIQYCSLRLFPIANFPTYILRAGPALGSGLTWTTHSHS